MAYRHLAIEDKNYEYVIGRTYTKVRGDAVFVVENTEIGNRVGTLPDGSPKVAVTPGTIAEYITFGRVKPADQKACRGCGKKDGTVSYCADPYAAEIHGKAYYSYSCDECVAGRAEDI